MRVGLAWRRCMRLAPGRRRRPAGSHSTPRAYPPPCPMARPRLATILNNLPLLLGALGGMTATSLLPMLAGRFAAGLGAGAASVLVPRYVSEIAPIPIRGALGTLNQAGATNLQLPSNRRRLAGACMCSGGCHSAAGAGGGHGRCAAAASSLGPGASGPLLLPSPTLP